MLTVLQSSFVPGNRKKCELIPRGRNPYATRGTVPHIHQTKQETGRGSIKARRVCPPCGEDRAPRGDRVSFLSFQGRRSDAQRFKPNSQLQGH